MKKKLGLSLGFIGSTTATFVPLAALVSCGNDVKTYDIKASEVADDKILAKLAEFYDDAGASSIKMHTTQDVYQKPEMIEQYWNKPEGNAIRIAAITTVLGKLWGESSDKVIAAIVKGGVYSVKEGTDAYKDGFINEYKIYLLTNINDFISRNHILDSLQKFDGFLTWIVDPASDYQNLKNTLVGGNIEDKFMIGIQNYLNKNKTDDKKVKVYPNNMNDALPESKPGAQTATTTPSVEGVTAIKASAVTPRVFADAAEKTKWFKDQYNLIKHVINANGWLAKVVPDQAAFEKYLLESKDTTIVDAQTNSTALEAGKLLRKMTVITTIGKIWGLNDVKAMADVPLAASRAFGAGEALKLEEPDEPKGIAFKEKQYIDTPENYAGFLTWMVDPQEFYSNLRSICLSGTNDQFKTFQKEVSVNSSNPVLKTIDMFSETTRIAPSAFPNKVYTQAEVDKWLSDKYDMIKQNYDPTNWMMQIVTDINQFKKYLLESKDATTVTPSGAPVPHTAADVGKNLRKTLIKGLVGSVWGVDVKTSVNNIVQIAVDSLGPNATNLEDEGIKGTLANIEFEHTKDLNDYINFTEWMIDSQEHYSNLRSLCGSPTDDFMKQFQKKFIDAGKVANPNLATLDIFA